MDNNHFRPSLLAAVLLPCALAACGGTKPAPAIPGDEARPETAPASGGGAPVQIEGLLGAIAQDDAERAIRRRNDAIAACYQEALDVSEQIEGALEIAFDVGADGSVAGAHLRNGTLGSLAAESCILEVARGIVFPAPRGGSRAAIVYPLALEKPYDDPAPPELDGGAAAAVARERAAEVDGCLGGAAGVQLTVWIARDGAVLSAGATSDSPQAAAAAACLARAARSWSFPAPGPKGARATIRF